jgi:hypothetical protein
MIARSAEAVVHFDSFVAKYLGRQGLVIISVGIAGAMALCCAWAVHPGQAPAHSLRVPTGYNREITVINLYLFRDAAPVVGLNFPSGPPS